MPELFARTYITGKPAHMHKLQKRISNIKRLDIYGIQ